MLNDFPTIIKPVSLNDQLEPRWFAAESQFINLDYVEFLFI